MLYASLKAAHLLAVVVWLGGMFFVLACLRPALAAIEPPARVRLMHAVLRRFLDAVAIAAAVVLVSGGTMVGLAGREAGKTGLRFNMPLDWYAMAALFVVMLGVFLHIRLVLFPRLAAAVRGEAWPAAASVLGTIRWEVIFNLAVGVFIVVMVRLGTGA